MKLDKTNANKINKEWRHFIVDKEVVSFCRYAENRVIRKSSIDVPSNLLEFVECHCFNNTGFYEHDINCIFSKVNEFIKNKMHITRLKNNVGF